MGKIQELVKYGRKRLEIFTSNLERAVVEGDPESVHELRVVSRRLDAPLQLAAEWMEKRRVKDARRGLKQVRRAFRDVRDLDVLMNSLSSDFTPKSAANMETGTLARLDGMLTSMRHQALQKAVRECESLDMKQIAHRVDGVFECFGEMGGKATEKIVDHLAGDCQRRALRILEEANEQSERPDLHQVRLGLKRLRYGTELICRLGRTEYEGVVVTLKEMQDLLGRWNDHLFAARKVADLATGRDQLMHEAGWSANVLAYAAQRAVASVAERATILQHWSDFQNELENGYNISQSVSRADPKRSAQAVSAN